jgi:cytoskeletal protein CcmA (bactofilin family)
LDDSLPSNHRGKLARAAARLPKAVDGMVTVKRGEGRRMVVGRDICLSGEIKSCDSLAVEGRVEADLKDCTTLEVLPSGVVKGNATVQRCEIAGLFQGDLTAEQYLLVRAGGRIQGNVSYKEIEVERGGHVTGQMLDMSVEEAETAGADADPIEPLSSAADFEKELEEERARLKALQASA